MMCLQVEQKSFCPLLRCFERNATRSLEINRELINIVYAMILKNFIVNSKKNHDQETFNLPNL